MSHLLDCTPSLQTYPEISQITKGGALSDVLLSRKMYFLISEDAPGFY